MVRAILTCLSNLVVASVAGCCESNQTSFQTHSYYGLEVMFILKVFFGSGPSLHIFSKGKVRLCPCKHHLEESTVMPRLIVTSYHTHFNYPNILSIQTAHSLNMLIFLPILNGHE